MRLIPDDTKINFMGLRWMGFGLSGFVTIGSMVLLLLWGLNLGVDFRGGVLIEARSAQALDLHNTRVALNGLGLGEVGLQEFGSDRDVLINLNRQEGGEAAQQAAVAKVRAALGEGVEYRRVEFVGPKVGQELIHAGVLATVLACLGIAVYIWFRFELPYAVAALIALVHDVITTVGVYALTQYEFNLATVAAVLTIAGYSINDTVVVFDRIRENARKYKSTPLVDLINRSCNEMLARTILVSMSTFLAVLALYLFGGEALHGFSFGILWGVIAGTYSSTLMAAPLLLYIKPKRGGDAPVAAEPAKG